MEAGLSAMGELAAITGFASFMVVAGIASHAFHSWLRQRERERLSTLDKEALSKRVDELDSKFRELRNTVNNGPARR